MKAKKGGLSPKLVAGVVALAVAFWVLRGRSSATTAAAAAVASTPTEFVSPDAAALANLSQQLGTLSQQLNAPAPAAAATATPGPTNPGWLGGPRQAILSGPF